MKIVQMIKKLNNTELGKAGTHDTYILIPNDLDIRDIFENENTPIEFKDKNTGEKIKIRNTVGREKRVVGLGQYYRSKDLVAGDEIILESHISSKGIEHFVSVNKNFENLVIQNSKYGFEILTPEKRKDFVKKASEIKADVSIKYLQSKKKRNDSPDTTDFYDVLISGVSIKDKYRSKDIVEIRIEDDEVIDTEFYGWKKYIFEVEE